jgi:hypothetical protein
VALTNVPSNEERIVLRTLFIVDTEMDFFFEHHKGVGEVYRPYLTHVPKNSGKDWAVMPSSSQILFPTHKGMRLADGNLP